MEQKRGIECSICMDIFTDPHILGCYHSFCKKCIDGLDSGLKVKCPLCNAYSDRNVVKPNYAFNDALQEMKQMEELRLREKGSHSKGVPLTEDKNVHNLCGICEKGRVEFRCIDCNDWLCVECRNGHKTIKATKDHVLENLSQCNNKMKEQICKQTNIIKETIARYTDNCSMFTKEICSVQQIQTSTLKKLSDLRDKIIKEIRTRFIELDKQIKLLCEDQVKKLMEYAEDNGNPIESLKKRLQELDAEIKSHKNDLAIIGEQILMDVKTVTDSHVPRNYRITPFSLEVVLSPAWKLMEILTLKNNSSQLHCDETSLATSSLHGLLKKQWMQRKSVGVKSRPYSLRLIDDQLWLCHKTGISMFTLDLDPIEHSQCVDIGKIYDIASTAMDEVAVASSRGLYTLAKDGSKTGRIADGTFSGVCFHDDQLFAAEYHSHTVCVYRWNDRTWAKHTVFGVDEGFATLRVNRAGIWMCVSEQNKFYHYSHNGELLSSSGISSGEGIDEIGLSFLCSVDIEGTALISDYDNNRLKLLNINSMWRSIDLQPRVQRPLMALFHSERLFINSKSPATLHMYT